MLGKKRGRRAEGGEHSGTRAKDAAQPENTEHLGLWHNFSVATAQHYMLPARHQAGADQVWQMYLRVR